MAIAQLGSDNLSVKTILCDVFMGINSITPLALGGPARDTAGGLTWAVDKLASVGLSKTVLGCPNDSLSPIYPNATDKGGPLNPPPAVVANSGNNTYNKVYFTEAPTKPQCNHVA